MNPSPWPRLGAEIESFIENIRELPVINEVAPAEIRSELKRYSFKRAIPLEKVMDDVSRLLRQWNVHVTHPRCFGLFNPGVTRASIVGDALAALYNPQLAVWSHAPAANEIERWTLRFFAAALGLDPDTTHANFTSGGAEANLSAVLAALAWHFPESGQTGLAALPRPVIYVTGESHHSFVKIARMTGLGTDSLREIAPTDALTFDVDALRRAICADTQAGRHPLMIVATAGTTGAGVIDPLRELAAVAVEYGAWLHVDAAWGAAASLSPRLKPALAGIESADSVTWDAHKWLSVPMGAGMFFCRHADAVKSAFAISTSYMPRDSGGTDDPYSSTVQWSRRAIGLKVFMSLAELGASGYGEMIDRQARIGDKLRERLTRAGWIVVNETPLPVVCFSHPAIRAKAVGIDEILQTLYARGKVWISDVALGKRERVLRACITSFRTDESDLDCLLDELENALRTGVSD